MTDAILALAISVGLEPPNTISRMANINGDGEIRLEEIFYIIQKVARSTAMIESEDECGSTGHQRTVYAGNKVLLS